MKEKPEEDARKETIAMIAEIAPHLIHKVEDIVDTVHRVGKKELGKPRQVIVQFTMRKYRDEIWRSTKNSSVCRPRSSFHGGYDEGGPAGPRCAVAFDRSGAKSRKDSLLPWTVRVY